MGRQRGQSLAFLSFVLSVCLAAGLAASANAASEAPSIKLVVRTERPSAVYEAGETATFIVELTEKDQPVASAEVDCELSTDAFGNSEKRQLAIVGGEARIQASRDKPCVLWVRATYRRDADEPIKTVSGAVFSPERIEPSMPPPDDFDEFWEEQKARLARIPVNAKLERVEIDDDSVEIYAVTMDNINDTKIYGYLGRPVGDGPFPASVRFQWSGVYSLDPNWVRWPAQQGFLALNINAHAVENGKPKEYYRSLSEGPLSAYTWQGRESRESCYFLRMYLACHRAVDYLASRPDWDGRHLIVTGSSQGGGQTIVAAGLNPRVTAVAACVPAMCDQTALALPDRAPGWPRMVSVRDGKLDPVHVETARYYDAVNFARKITAPALFATGFADLTCPSSSVYAAYNVLSGPKRMALDPLSEHSGNKPNWSKAYAELIEKHSKD